MEGALRLELHQTLFQIFSVSLGRAFEPPFLTDYLSFWATPLSHYLGPWWGSSLWCSWLASPRVEPQLFKQSEVRPVMTLGVCLPYLGQRLSRAQMEERSTLFLGFIHQEFNPFSLELEGMRNAGSL